MQTRPSYVVTFLRLVAGVVVFPYGMQKLFGWFGGLGVRGSIQQIAGFGVPPAIAWLVLIGQSFGSVALMLGFLTRIAAAGLIVIFAGALVMHSRDGWMMNWFGKKRGEGIEYFVLLLALLIEALIEGGGALSVDLCF
jgi:putative oxidoreductase